MSKIWENLAISENKSGTFDFNNRTWEEEVSITKFDNHGEPESTIVMSYEEWQELIAYVKWLDSEFTTFPTKTPL